MAREPHLHEGPTPPAAAVIPSEGVTGWADTWMISANAPHPNCMLKWMDYTLQPDVQARGRDLLRSRGLATRSRAQVIAESPRRGRRRTWSTPSSTRSAATRSSWTRSTCGRRRRRTARRPGQRVRRLLASGRRLDRGHGLPSERRGIGDRRRRTRRSRRRRPQRRRRLPATASAARLLLTLGPPLAWMVVIYLGSLVAVARVVLLAPGRLHRQDRAGLGLHQLPDPLGARVYRTIVLRTVGIAAAVTVDGHRPRVPARLLRRRIATPRMRNALLIAVVLPLWANYLVRVFAWRIDPHPQRLPELGRSTRSDWAPLQLGRSNWAIWLTFGLPVAAVHAAADLRVARAGAGVVPRGVRAISALVAG